MSKYTDKFAALTAKIAALQAELAALVLAGDAGCFDPKVGDVVVYRFGRGENTQNYVGKVLGIRAPAEGEKGGTIAKVLTGEGYDAEVRGVFLSKIARLATEDEVLSGVTAQVEATAEEVVADASEPTQGADEPVEPANGEA